MEREKNRNIWIPTRIFSGARGRHAVMLFIEGQSTGFSCDETKIYMHDFWRWLSRLYTYSFHLLGSIFPLCSSYTLRTSIIYFFILIGCRPTQERIFFYVYFVLLIQLTRWSQNNNIVMYNFVFASVLVTAIIHLTIQSYPPHLFTKYTLS